MGSFRFLTTFITAIFTFMCAGLSAWAQDVSPIYQGQTGPETSFHGTDLAMTGSPGTIEAPSLFQLSMNLKDDPAFQHYRRLRNTGILFSAIGGAMMVAGGVLLGTSLGYNCGLGEGDDKADGAMAELGCVHGAAIQGVLGGTIMGTGGLFFLTPGIVMTVSGHKKMALHLQSRAAYRRQLSNRLVLQGVSLVGSSTGKRMGGLTVNFAF